MPAALLDMHGVADFRACHYDTVRKGWRAWVVQDGFPAPVEQRPYKWNPDSLSLWAARREVENRDALLRTAAGAVAPANENRPAPCDVTPPARRIDRQRAAVMALMASGRASARAAQS